MAELQMLTEIPDVLPPASKPEHTMLLVGSLRFFAGHVLHLIMILESSRRIVCVCIYMHYIYMYRYRIYIYTYSYVYIIHREIEHN